MTGDSLIQVLQLGVDLPQVDTPSHPLEDRTRLLSDNGSGYVSRSFRGYLNLIGIRHILDERLTILKPTGNWAVPSEHRSTR